METKGYIWKVLDFSSGNKKLRSSTINILQCFTLKNSVSVSDVYRMLEPTKNKIAYKNIHKTFYGFKEYIQYCETVQYNTKLNRLTPEGIFVLFRAFSRDAPIMLKDLKGVFRFYRHEEIFEALLYPYISWLTLFNLKNTEIYLNLFDYLRLCCLEINSAASNLFVNGSVNDKEIKKGSSLFIVIINFKINLASTFLRYQQYIRFAVSSNGEFHSP